MASPSNDSTPSSPAPGPSSTRNAPASRAPTYTIPNTEIAAVEIPAVVQNIDRAISAFGRVSSFDHVMDPRRNSLPLYLNPESPFCNPIMSHNAASHNIVLKITVPKRTGRKRKRGSSGPWEGDREICDVDEAKSSSVCSIARQDEPKILRRKLQDNVGHYKVDAVGIVHHTHRFRGLADFYWDMSTSSFANRYVDQVLSGDVEKMKAFTLEPGIDKTKNSDVIPPPLFTHMSLPFNYFYSQNPYVRTTADGGTVNVTAVKQVGYFISAEDPAPTGPQESPDVTDPRFMEVLADLEAAFEDRPIWTRRSLLNHLGKKLDSWNELKKYLNYAAYQFKGGPWRDCVVPYGVDPRTDPKYRVYQTLMFKLTKHKRPQGPTTVRTYRRPEKVEERQAPAGAASHVFDGETYDTDGKVWQVCDITDPLLRELLDQAAVRPTWDVSSGWYHGGLWAKVKAVMKTKLVGIRFGRRLSRADFAPTLQFGDRTPPRSASSNFHLPLPNLRLTDEELTALRGRKPPRKKSQGYNVKLQGRAAAAATAAADDPASVASSPSRAPTGAVDDNDEDSGADSNDDNDDSVSELDDDDQLDQPDYSGQGYGGQDYSGQDYNGQDGNGQDYSGPHYAGAEYGHPYRYEYSEARLNAADDSENVYPELE
ncbi:RNA polymerase III transcription factor subunit [Cordyceps javanica]|uniref:RNA polymerase III transcription factor subunit n=1 Tax=Cordyceps javanica TaxID=43265 RepID=A0A545UN65_9HYPO|nr:RNA polymerase III transcription factor subunit [Cordyceps javanica]TQW02656.1 RNA polymerase III transcription factor subunit [Cordyceps javanica]